MYTTTNGYFGDVDRISAPRANSVNVTEIPDHRVASISTTTEYEFAQ